MRNQYKIFIILATGTLLLLASTSVVRSQIRRIPIGGVSKPVTRPVGPVTSKPKQPKAAGVRRSNQQATAKDTNLKENYLEVNTEAGARVILESKGAKPVKTEQTTNSDGKTTFRNIRPGSYKLQAIKEGFDTEVNETVPILAGQGLVLPMELEPVKYKLKIATNVMASGGDVRYARAKLIGKDAKGEIISEPIGNYCVVAIKPNGEALIEGLSKGYYDIDIRSNSLEFANTFTGVNVPDDIEPDAGDAASGFKTVAIDLEKNQSKEEFNAAWIRSEWNMPATWRFDPGLKVRNVAGIALPQNERYRQYVEFEMIADVKLRDDGTVGFVLRAEDEKNYYLLKLSGAKAPDANTAQLFNVENGVMKPQPISTAPTVSFAKTISNDGGFRIYVVGDGKGFAISIDDSDTGKKQILGFLPDTFETHKKGAIGIAGFQKADFDINFFRVCYPKCRQ